MPIIKTPARCPECAGSGTILKISTDSLTAIRLAAGLSYRQLALKTPFSYNYFALIERGERRCTPEIEKIYNALLPVRKQKQTKGK